MKINESYYYSNSLNSKFDLTESSKITSTNHRFYESSEEECKPCQKSSCQGCCLKDFFTQLKNFITYPFVKLYELLFGSSSKKEGKDIEGTEENKTKSKERSSSPKVSDDEAEEIFSIDSTTSKNEEASESESEDELENLPRTIDRQFFFELGEQNISLDNASANKEEQEKIISLAQTDENCKEAYNQGYARHLGINSLPLPVELHPYQEFYYRGVYGTNYTTFFELGRTNTRLNESDEQFATNNPILRERYNCGFAFGLGESGFDLPPDLQGNQAYEDAHKNGCERRKDISS